MFDSEIDSWYDCKRGDDLNEMQTVNDAENRNDVCLFSCDRSKNFATDDFERRSSRSNGLIRYDTIPASSRSSTEVRFINPAIYAETLNDEDIEHEVEIQVKINPKNDGHLIRNCGDSAGMSDMMSTLSINNDLAASFMDHAGDQGSAQETYRCYSLNSPTTSASLQSDIVRSKSVTSCKLANRVERRCKIAERTGNSYDVCSTGQIEPEVEQRYTFNGHRTVEVSSSISSMRISKSRPNESGAVKKITYSEWMRRKQEMARRRKEEEDLFERQRQMEEERLAREKQERECRERENFLKWSERKKKEEEKKKAAMEKELKLQKQLKEVEDKTAVVKTLYLRQWARKKKEEEKARRKKEEMKREQEEEERKKRLEKSTRAYENWRKMAKNKPRPATQGLLPHQKVKPAYINPTPWQRIVDDTEDIVEENAFNVGGKGQTQPKISNKKSATSYQ
ncbi:hypothetical protein E2986_02203 [Frieseomelitta varia]|uniref:Coiled-coil domain-containing protein n=1 Tax=Frieseomelitta varia TaxID=561572 RepID=A0A833S4T9_9HYME|nr:stress response protein NST1-like isoform X2 [Frieseomelitta varia]KAF3428671.1 hypothetical protein E2986_02203 [Frieseomelitta varia]